MAYTHVFLWLLGFIFGVQPKYERCAGAQMDQIHIVPGFHLLRPSVHHYSSLIFISVSPYFHPSKLTA